jgi:hypothetical protein
VSKSRPYARANVDGYALAESWRKDTGWWPVRALEVKCTGADNRTKWEYLPPLSYLVQCLHNREVLRENGLKVPIEIVVLIGGNDYGRTWIPEMPEVVSELKKREAQFWFCVTENVPPRVERWFPRYTIWDDEEEDAEVATYLQESGGSGVQIPPPSEGSHQGVLVDIHQLGEVKTEYRGEVKMKRKIKLVFALPRLPKIPSEIDGEEVPEFWANKTRCVSKSFTESLDERSTLYKFLRGWLGARLTPEKIELLKTGKADMDKLLGMNAIVTVAHFVTKDGNTAAYADSAAPLMEGMESLPIPTDYTRIRDRTDTVQKPEDSEPESGVEEEVPDLKFEEEDPLPF